VEILIQKTEPVIARYILSSQGNLLAVKLLGFRIHPASESPARDFLDWFCCDVFQERRAQGRSHHEIWQRSRGLARYVGRFWRLCGGNLNGNARVGSQRCTFAAQWPQHVEGAASNDFFDAEHG
jgi:hypothetical protein